MFPTLAHHADVCVIGGGMAGVCAALAAARHGAQVVLMHDRPVLGGNASSEVRVHICGADRHNGVKNMRETGILEELRLENLYRNPNKNFSVWDLLLYDTLRAEPNLTLLLNCSCLEAAMEGTHIASVTGWQTTAQRYHTVTAKVYVDSSGDSVLAPLTGAEFRVGREARSEFGESIAPEKADRCTMGMTCLFHARQHAAPQTFAPPAWAHRYDTCEQLPYGARGHTWFEMGYWWIELGGVHDSIHDTEHLRDELLKITLGVWDHIKNRCPHREKAATYALEWLQFLPGKRESRRYAGDHILTQLDIESEGRFEDLVAYGGWSMDDHHPEGFNAVTLGAPATIFHHAPSPYGIPYRSLYSKNITNLMCAGRNVSCTHAALSSLRVMGTGCSVGQAVGTAAALAVKKGISPRGMGTHMRALQQQLLYDDCYLPWMPQQFSTLTMHAHLAASHGDPAPVRDGINRPVGDDPHCWPCTPGAWIEYRFDGARRVAQATLIVDSGLDQNVAMSWHQRDDQHTSPPGVLPRALRVETLQRGTWQPLASLTNNYQRVVRVPVNKKVDGVRAIIDGTWGAPQSRVYAWYCD